MDMVELAGRVCGFGGVMDPRWVRYRVAFWSPVEHPNFKAAADHADVQPAIECTRSEYMVSVAQVRTALRRAKTPHNRVMMHVYAQEDGLRETWVDLGDFPVVD